MSESVPFMDLGPTTAEVRSEVEAAWLRAMDTNGFIGGRMVHDFEQAFAAYCGRRHAVGVANGTDALHVVLRALGVGRGDEVIVPANTFIATAEAVVLAGATPRFADVDPDTLLVTPATVADAVTPRTAAVLPVHLYGHVVDTVGVAAVADRHGLVLVEDAAQAHGASRGGHPAGTTGVAAAFSFYPGKNLGAFGDGGAVVLDDDALADRIRSVADHGRSVEDRYVHPDLGMNSRLDAVQAAVLSAKLRHLDRWTADRRALVEAYRERLALTESVRLVEPDPTVASAWHLLVVRVAGRDRVRDALSRDGVQTGVHYPVPCPQQPPFRQFADSAFPVAETAAEEVLSLPLHPHMTTDQVDVVCERLLEATSAGPVLTR